MTPEITATHTKGGTAVPAVRRQPVPCLVSAEHPRDWTRRLFRPTIAHLRHV